MPPCRLSRDERAAAQRQERRRRLLDAAAAEAVANGLHAMKRDDIARRAGLAAGAVNHEFETMAGLRDALMLDAIERRNLPILAQGLASGHPVAKGAPDDMRTEAARELI